MATSKYDESDTKLNTLYVELFADINPLIVPRSIKILIIPVPINNNTTGVIHPAMNSNNVVGVNFFFSLILSEDFFEPQILLHY